MTGEQSQIIFITSFGNVFVNGFLKSAPERTGNMNFFKSHVFIRFVQKRKFFFTQKEKIIASNTAKWFDDIRKRGAKQLRIVSVEKKQSLPDHVVIAYVSGGNWAIEVEFKNGYEVWLPFTEKVKEWSKTDNKIWGITFKGIENSRSLWVQNFSLDESEKMLFNSLKRILDFANRARVSYWGEYFIEALTKLQDESSVVNIHLPDQGYSSKAHRIMSSASSAWVFGGMGSWNDLWFEDKAVEAEYHEVSKQLYDAIITSYMAVTNEGMTIQ